jgi:acyl carrier protein
MKEIKEFLLTYFEVKLSTRREDVGNDTISNFMDSLDIADFVLAIETRYNIDVEDNFYETIDERSVDEIAEYIKTKLENKE